MFFGSLFLILFILVNFQVKAFLLEETKSFISPFIQLPFHHEFIKPFSTFQTKVLVVLKQHTMESKALKKSNKNALMNLAKKTQWEWYDAMISVDEPLSKR
jgi:hypothetical protein